MMTISGAPKQLISGAIKTLTQDFFIEKDRKWGVTSDRPSNNLDLKTTPHWQPKQ